MIIDKTAGCAAMTLILRWDDFSYMFESALSYFHHRVDCIKQE